MEERPFTKHQLFDNILMIRGQSVYKGGGDRCYIHENVLQCSLTRKCDTVMHGLVFLYHLLYIYLTLLKMNSFQS